MKPKILILLLTLALFLSSCQQVMDNPSLDAAGLTEVCKSKSNSAGPQKNYFPDGWQTLSSHAEKLAALQLDEGLLKSLSTKELVEVCIDYPLAYDCFFYNDINKGFKRVISRFNGFQELAARSDAKLEIINYYHNFVETDYYNTISGTSKISPFKLSFIELMVQSEQFGDLSLHSDNVNLIDALSKIEIILTSNPVLQGQICSQVFARFSDYVIIEKTENPIIKIPDWYKPIIIYTKNGWAVDAIKFHCKSPDPEEEEFYYYIKNAYPKVEIVDNASCEYNCHAYAWYVSEGGERCWINSGPNGPEDTSNVEKFWKDGYYVECEAKDATKVFYGNGGDHSALVINPNLFESKWGAGHVVRHKPGECDYDASDLHFYKPKANNPGPDPDPDNEPSTYYGTVTWDMYPDPIPIGYAITFYIENYYNSLYNIDVYLSTIKDNNNNIVDPSVYTIISQNGNSATMTINKWGTYYVWFKITDKSTDRIEAIYQSDFIYVQ